jgi:hypothetical protein
MKALSVALVLLFAADLVPPVFAQTTTTGNVTVTVADPGGSVVPDAALELLDTGTNELRKGTTQASGAYEFHGLPFGTYRLTVSKTGFANAVFESVQVQTGRITDVRATLTLGRTIQTVEVAAATPLVESSASTLSTTIDTKQVVNLPVQGRSVMSLAFLAPGWAASGVGNNGAANVNGTWNNMPGGAVVSADFDGTPGISNRFRSGGFNYGTTSVQPRIEDIAEMTIQTGQLDLSGTGTSAMRISMVTRRGTNEFHGRLYEDFRNTALNANSWSNNARGLPRNIIKLNEFGASVGGRIIRNKLFFFGTWAQSIQPRSINANPVPNVLSPAAQQGNFTYRDTAGVLRTVNVLQIAGNAGYRSTILPSTAAQLQKINSVLNLGALSPTSDPNISTFNFQVPAQTNVYYPTIRVDYAATDNIRLNLSYAQTKTNATHTNSPVFPGGIDPLNYASNGSNNRIAGFGLDWTIRPTLINQFHAGYMYQYSIFDIENLGVDLNSIFIQTWNYGSSLYGNPNYRQPISSFYPLLSANDSLSWQKGDHSFVFGASWYREQDHYWNGPGGYPNYTFNVSAQDPVAAVINGGLPNASTTNQANAQALYAALTGRVSAVSAAGGGRPLNPATKQYEPLGAYNLDEVQSATGLWAQDRWRLRPNLTLNFGLRWDFVGDNWDVNGGYSTLPTLGDIWGPTPVGAMFSPGTLGGVQNPVFKAQVHAYKPSYVNPSPAFALAWNPQSDGPFNGKLIGKGTVIRAGYSLRAYQEGAQNFWAYASNAGQFFFQQGNLNSNPASGVGNFAPGSLTFGDPLPPYALTPPVYSTTTPAANLFPSTLYGLNPNIRQPYVQQWNFGIQRQIGNNSALEIRYVGNLALHQWLGYNINEVNIIENGFLKEFKNAQSNLAANRAAGRGNTFANLTGVPGDVPLPIFTAAFGGPASSNFSNGTFITNLNTGAAGTLANTLAGTGSNINFYCNMVGTAAFPACANRVGNVAGAGYPINFWQVNPYAAGRAVNYLDAAGSSNYHAMQVEFRQRPVYGMQFNVNYTWSHSLGISTQNGIQGQNPLIYYTNRNFNLNYGPSLFDIRHVVHASGTYDLPFGKGRKFLNSGGLVNGIFGGWTLGTIFVMQSGTPIQIVGGYATLNANTGVLNGGTSSATIAGDSGIYYNGITPGDVQSSVGVYKSGNPWVNIIGPQFIASNGAAASALTPANIPGVLGSRAYVYGPHWFNADVSVNKSIPITERLRLTLQTEFLNLTNHPTFSILNGGQNGPQNFNVQALNFGQVTSGPSSARAIEFRANIEF